jgi:hypothetical protein
VEDRAHVTRLASWIRQHRLPEVFLVAGDAPEPVGAYDSVVPFLVTPFLAVAVGLVIYWGGAAHIGKRGSLSDLKWQRLSVFLVIVCMVVVPSVALTVLL